MKTQDFAVSEIITLVRRAAEIEPEGVYQELGIRSFGRGTFHKTPVSGIEIGKKRVFHINSGDLLFSSVFAWEGAVAIATPDDDGLVGSHRFMTYQVDESVADIRYLCNFFHSGPGLDAIRAASPGSAGRNKTLGIESFARQRITLPLISEQKRIASRLDALLRRADTVRQLQLRSSEIFSALAESLVDSATSTVAELQRVGDIIRLVRQPIDIDAASRYRAIGARSFGKGMILYPPTRGDDLSKLSYFQLPPNALLLSNIKAWEGAISVTTEDIANDFVASNRFLSYLPVDERVNTSYLRHYFLSRRGLAQISTASPGGTDRNRTLGRQRFEALSIPLPPRAEQDRIAAILDGLADRLERARANPAVQALRPAILNAAFTGQL